MTHEIWKRTAAAIAVVLAAGILLSMGCENTPRDKLNDGKRALADGDLVEAEQRLEAALEADPELVEARRLLATTYIEDEQFEAAERELEELWDDQGFDREGELGADERQTRQLMSEQFSQLYQNWAKSVDPGDDPEQFEAIAQAGLERNSRDSTLNTMLVEFYEDWADRHVERSDKVQAAEMLERIDELHRFPDTRRESRKRAKQLRREAFEPEAVERFETELLPELEEMGAWNGDDEVISMTIGQPPDGRLDPEDEQAVEQARNTAAQTLVPTLSQYAVVMARVDSDEVETTAVQLPQLTVEDEEFGPGSYEMTVAMPLTELVDMAFALSEYERTDAADQPYQNADEEPLVAGDKIPLDTSPIDNDD